MRISSMTQIHDGSPLMEGCWQMGGEVEGGVKASSSGVCFPQLSDNGLRTLDADCRAGQGGIDTRRLRGGGGKGG